MAKKRTAKNKSISVSSSSMEVLVMDWTRRRDSSRDHFCVTWSQSWRSQVSPSTRTLQVSVSILLSRNTEYHNAGVAITVLWLGAAFRRLCLAVRHAF